MAKVKKRKGVILAYDSGTETIYIGARHPDGRTEIIADFHGHIPTLSDAGFEGGDPEKLIYGKQARNYRKLAPEFVTQMNKRVRGKHEGSGLVTLIDKDNRPWAAEEIEARLLGTLVRHAEEFLGVPVEGVLITVPACFDDVQRKASVAIVEAAGCRCLGLINEPTAAVLGYFKANPQAGTAMVSDGGKGTWDITIMQMLKDNAFQVKATKGIDDLAGREMTLALVEHCAKYAESMGAPMSPDTGPQDYVLLEEAAEEAKLALSNLEKTVIVWRAGTKLFDLEVTRAEFENLLAPMLDAIRGLVRETLDAAGMTPADLSIVIPAGGSSRVPAVRQLLEEIFGPDKVMKNVDPDRAVILGALEAIPLKIKEAVDSGQTDFNDIAPEYVIDSRISLTDVLGDTLGVRAIRPVDGATVLTPIVEANTPLPCSKERVFGLKQEQGKVVNADIAVLQGDPNAPVDDATTLEVFPLEGLPPGPESKRIAVRFDIDTNGLVSVHARDNYSGQEIRGRVQASRKHNQAMPVM